MVDPYLPLCPGSESAEALEAVYGDEVSYPLRYHVYIQVSARVAVRFGPKDLLSPSISLTASALPIACSVHVDGKVCDTLHIDPQAALDESLEADASDVAGALIAAASTAASIDASALAAVETPPPAAAAYIAATDDSSEPSYYRRFAVVRIDHMRRPGPYKESVLSFFRSSGAHGALVQQGRHILVLLCGCRASITRYLRMHRTTPVDVDGKGRRCKEKKMDVLWEGERADGRGVLGLSAPSTASYLASSTAAAAGASGASAGAGAAASARDPLAPSLGAGAPYGSSSGSSTSPSMTMQCDAPARPSLPLAACAEVSSPAHLLALMRWWTGQEARGKGCGGKLGAVKCDECAAVLSRVVGCGPADLARIEAEAYALVLGRGPGDGGECGSGKGVAASKGHAKGAGKEKKGDTARRTSRLGWEVQELTCLRMLRVLPDS